MNEEDFIEQLFKDADINYPVEGIENTVLKRIEINNTYKKKKQLYFTIGKIGFAILICLSLLFTLVVKETDLFYLFLGSPFILLLLMFPFQILFNQKAIKKN